MKQLRILLFAFYPFFCLGSFNAIQAEPQGLKEGGASISEVGVAVMENMEKAQRSKADSDALLGGCSLGTKIIVKPFCGIGYAHGACKHKCSDICTWVDGVCSGDCTSKEIPDKMKGSCKNLCKSLYTKATCISMCNCIKSKSACDCAAHNK